MQAEGIVGPWWRVFQSLGLDKDIYLVKKRTCLYLGLSPHEKKSPCPDSNYMELTREM